MKNSGCKTLLTIGVLTNVLHFFTIAHGKVYMRKLLFLLFLASLAYSYEITGEGYAKVTKSKPSIAFVLTTWEKKGAQTTVNVDGSRDSRSRNQVDYDYEESNRNSSRNRESAEYRQNNRNSRRGEAEAELEYDYRQKNKRNTSSKSRFSADDDELSYRNRYRDNRETSGSVKGRARYSGEDYNESEGSYSGNSERESDSYAAKKGRANVNTASNEEFHNSTTIGVISEDLWKKIPDMQIVDRFQQEFKDKGFVVKAADAARDIALASTLAKTGIDPSDRGAVREFAEKENVNFVARGEVAILSYQETSRGVSTTTRIGVEVIDVNSGEVVASYSNTVTASGRSQEAARSSGIVKMAVVAARKLAYQSMENWVDAAENGASFTVEVRNVKSARSQKLPFEKALKSIAEISSQTSPREGVLSYVVVYKGSKSDLGTAIIEAVGDKKGFEEENFDGPNDENGKIVFGFTK